MDILRRIQDLGVGNSQGDEARRIRAINLIGTIGGIFVAFYGLIYGVYDFAAYWPVVAANMLCSAGYFLAPLCNAQGRVNAAMWVLAGTAWFNMTSSSLLLGTGVGIHYYLVAVAALAAIVTPAGHWMLAALAAGVSVGLFVLAHFAFTEPLLKPLPAAIAGGIAVATPVGTMVLIAVIVGYYRLVVDDAEAGLQRANERSERLLHAILPAAVAERLKDAGGTAVSQRHDDITVLFADVVGFTAQAAAADADDMVTRLNRLYTAFDELTAQHGLEKIKTMGDAYMAAGGLPLPQPDHAPRSARLALALMTEAGRLGAGDWPGLMLRIGLHSGPAVAGVIGSTKFAYDVWGDTVNIASRLQEQAHPGQIIVSEATRQRLGEDFVLGDPLPREIRGKGVMQTYQLRGGVQRQLR